MLELNSRLEFETNSTEIRLKSEMIWNESGAWSGIKTLGSRQSVPKSSRSLKWSELNQVLDLKSSLRIWNNQYQNQTGVWSDLYWIKFLRFTDQLYFNGKTWNDLKGRVVGQFYTTWRRSMKGTEPGGSPICLTVAHHGTGKGHRKNENKMGFFYKTRHWCRID